MDYFEGVVSEYLRADRGMFLNATCLLQLDPGEKVNRGRHWYCDIVAVSFRERAVFLCEVSYSESLQALLGRLRAWDQHWNELCAAIARDCAVPADWRVQPWVFFPKDLHPLFLSKLPSLDVGDYPERMPQPRITHLESVVPWKYSSRDRQGVEA